MNKLTRLLKNYLPALLAVVTLSVSSCRKEDEEPVYPKPQLTLEGGDSRVFKPGAPVSVNLNLDAEGGAKSLIVNRDGGFLEEVSLDPNATTYTYATQTVPATAAEGDQIEYSFVLVNRQDTESDPVVYTADVAVYDPLTIGTTQVYNVALPADGVVPSSQTVTFAEGRNYFLERSATFAPGSRLVIGPGVTVYMNTTGEEDVDVSINGEVEIAGTQAAPVVMTSDKSLRGATPESGDWGDFEIEGQGAGTNSGAVSYLRIEYAGEGMRLDDVGSGTTIANVQVFNADNEGFYITDGDVNLSRVVATNAGEGGFRLGDAYAGRLQYLIAVVTGREADEDELTIRETSNAVVSNATLIGPGAAYANDMQGIRLRAGSQGKIYNTIVAEFPRRGVRATDQVVITDLSGPTVFAHSYVFNIGRDAFATLALPFAGTFDPATGAQLTNPFNNNVTAYTEAAGYTTTPIAGIGVNDYVPDAEIASTFNPTSLGPFFQAAPFVGAIQNASADWTKGWVKNPDGSVRP